MVRSKNRWRSRENVQARHEYIIELRGKKTNHWGREGRARLRPLSLKEIALKVSEKFGTENGRKKPLDHSSVLHQLRKHEEGKCLCRVRL